MYTVQCTGLVSCQVSVRRRMESSAQYPGFVVAKYLLSAFQGEGVFPQFPHTTAFDVFLFTPKVHLRNVRHGALRVDLWLCLAKHWVAFVLSCI